LGSPAFYFESGGENLHFIALLSLLLTNETNHHANSPDTIVAPLWLYQGTWQVTRESANKGAKSDRVVNHCALLGKYFACQQTVNDSEGGLLIIIPAGKPGHYYTETITPEGRATRRSELEISGDRWTFSSRWPQENGKIVYYRTTNTFTGKNRIHFEQAESSDGTQWAIKDSGDEQRVAAGRR
jgi:hypothetical protein